MNESDTPDLDNLYEEVAAIERCVKIGRLLRRLEAQNHR